MEITYPCHLCSRTVIIGNLLHDIFNENACRMAKGAEWGASGVAVVLPLPAENFGMDKFNSAFNFMVR